MTINQRYLTNLRRMGLLEGISTLALFGIAMPLKYAANMPMAVTIVGTIHGFLFVGLVLMFLVGMSKIPLSRQLAAAGIVCAVFPFGPFVVDVWLKRVSAQQTSGNCEHV